MGEVDLTERVTAHAAFGAHDSRFTGFYGSSLQAINSNGSATGTADKYNQYDTYLTGDVSLRALVDTGPIGHQLAIGATSLAQDTGFAFIRAPLFDSNFYNPTIIAPPGIPTPMANKSSTVRLSSLGIADTLSSAEKRVQLTVGARLQQVAVTNFNPTTGAQTSYYDQSALSPSVALVVKPFWENESFYANWIQGLQQGSIVGATFTNAGEAFPPFKTTQYEAGVKIDWGRFTATASVFQIFLPPLLTNVATNTQFLGGEQRNQGLEINVFGEPTEGVRLLGGAMFLNPVLSKTQGGLTDGWIAPFAPQLNVNLASEWDTPFAQGLTLIGHMIYTGSQYIDTTWPRRSLPEWKRFDIGARSAFENPGAKGKLLVARFNVENVLDADYWAGGNGPLNMNLGAPRTFRVSLTTDF